MAIDSDKKRYQITLPKEMARELEETCRKLGISKSSAVALALNSWFKHVDEGSNANR